MNGYSGRILCVELGERALWDEPLAEEWARGYVGGSGLAACYVAEMVDADTDALAPESPLVFMTGPLVGTTMPSAGRYSVGGLSPLTGRWGEANAGGFFGPELRFAGYDGVVVTGRSEEPVWLAIVDGHATLRDARALWGSNTYTTQDLVRRELGEARARVACIGPAGERLVKMAAIINDHGRAAGRTGLGALMGSKRLKAIAARGTARTPVPLADPAGFQAAVKEILLELRDDVAATALRLAGTAGYVDMALMLGDLPVRYFQQGEWEAGGDLSGVLLAERYQNRNVSCFRCPIACGRETRAPRYGLAKVDGPEYETIGAFGTLLLVNDPEAIIYAGHLCNELGLDTISAGCTIALACELFARGVIGREDTGGLEPRYGDASTVLRLAELLGRREGFGAVLAEGSQALAERFGVPELAVTVNRLEVPMHDPRAFAAMAAVYALSPRGACHCQADVYAVDLGESRCPELGIMPGDRFESSEAKGRTVARQLAWRNLYDALVLCNFQNPGVPRLLAAVNAATGWDLTADDLLRLGKHILNRKRLLNLRRGLTPADERLPALLLQPLAEGGTGGRVPDSALLLAGAYAELGWDPASGVPADSPGP